MYQSYCSLFHVHFQINFLPHTNRNTDDIMAFGNYPCISTVICTGPGEINFKVLQYVDCCPYHLAVYLQVYRQSNCSCNTIIAVWTNGLLNLVFIFLHRSPSLPCLLGWTRCIVDMQGQDALSRTSTRCRRAADIRVHPVTSLAFLNHALQHSLICSVPVFKDEAKGQRALCSALFFLSDI